MKEFVFYFGINWISYMPAKWVFQNWTLKLIKQTLFYICQNIIECSDINNSFETFDISEKFVFKVHFVKFG